MTALPEWIDAELWTEYVQQRKKDKKAMSPRSERDRIARLYELKAAGHDPNLALAEALNNHWLDVYEPKDKTIAQKRRPGNGDAHSATQRWLREQREAVEASRKH